MWYNIITVKERNKSSDRPLDSVGESEKVMKYTVYSRKYLATPVIALETNDLQKVVEYYLYESRQAEKLQTAFNDLIKNSNNEPKRMRVFGININVNYNAVNKSDGTPVTIDDLIKAYVTLYETYQQSFNTSMSPLQKIVFNMTFKTIWKKLPKLDGEITVVRNDKGIVIGEFGTEKD